MSLLLLFVYVVLNLCFPIVAPIGQQIHRLLTVQMLRPDRLLSSAHLFVSAVFGEHFMPQAERQLNMAHIVENEVCC